MDVFELLSKIAASIANTDTIAFIIILYFLYKDYRFNENIINVLSAVREVLTKLEMWHAKEEK